MIYTFLKVIEKDATSILYFNNNSLNPIFSNLVVVVVFDTIYIFLITLISF